MGIIVQPERIVKSGSAAVCVNTYHGVWRPVSLILTDERLICQQGNKVVLSVPLYAFLAVEVVKTRVMLGLKRKSLLIHTGKAKRLICMNNPEEWMNIILQSTANPRLQTEVEREGTNS
jgi:hypothetical protein